MRYWGKNSRFCTTNNSMKIQCHAHTLHGKKNHPGAESGAGIWSFVLITSNLSPWFLFWKNFRNSAQVPIPGFRVPLKLHFPVLLGFLGFFFFPDVPFCFPACIFNQYLSLLWYFSVPDSTQLNLPQESPWASSVTTPIPALLQKKKHPILTETKNKNNKKNPKPEKPPKVIKSLHCSPFALYSSHSNFLQE